MSTCSTCIIFLEVFSWSGLVEDGLRGCIDLYIYIYIYILFKRNACRLCAYFSIDLET